jgi:hypothetical protein
VNEVDERARVGVEERVEEEHGLSTCGQLLAFEDELKQGDHLLRLYAGSGRLHDIALRQTL